MTPEFDFQAKTTISFKDVPKVLPRRNGKKIHYCTVYRWATRGARGRILESQMIGGVRYTNLAALSRFLKNTNISIDDRRVAEALRRIHYGEESSNSN